MIRLIAIIFVLFFSACYTSEITKTETSQYQFSHTTYTAIDSTAYQTILPYKTKLDVSMNAVLAKTDKPMIKDVPEGLLGNLVADLILYEANKYYNSGDGHPVDFCLLNNGGLRASLPEGNITRGKVFELMPFENEMIVVELNGQTTLELIQFIAEKGGMPVSGLRFEIESGKPMNIIINNKPFDITENYKMVTSDYLAHGGDKLTMLKKRLGDQLVGIKIRDAIIEYFIEMNEKEKIITSELDGRIKYVH